MTFPISTLTAAQIAIIAGWTNGTGVINAAVQPRSNTLASLQALAGLPGEWGYPTDYPDAMVRFTGVAGQARTFWKSGVGADLKVVLSGGYDYYVPDGVSVASIYFSGSTADSFNLHLNLAQSFGVFVVNNQSGFDCQEEESGANIGSGYGQIFIRVPLGSSGLFIQPIGTNFST